jgi:curved DNA-binding protein CbpA
MTDYYQILGLKPDASSTSIRSAYKRLAMLYHPDRNPGNAQAEELFKIINEAYQVLSHTAKKQQYDMRYHGLNHKENHSTAHDMRAYWREYHRKQYEHWRQNQQPAYQFDKRYFRIQGLAIVTFLVIAGFCFGLIHLVEYFHNKEQEKKYKANVQALQQVHSLFNTGKKKEALTQIRNLQQQQPLEYLFTFAEDTLLFTLLKQADVHFKNQKFELAGYHYNLLKDFQDPVSPHTLLRLAECDYALGNYSRALNTFLQLHKQQPESISIIYAIALVYHDKLQNLTEAERYLTMGKKNFKRSMAAAYGEAFEIVADPADVSEIYFDIFIRRMRVNLALKKYDEAETDGNWAIYLRPKNAESYFWRAQVLQKTGSQSKMCADLQLATQLGKKEASKLLSTLCR